MNLERSYRFVDVVLGFVENPRKDVFVGDGNVSIALEIHCSQSRSRRCRLGWRQLDSDSKDPEETAMTTLEGVLFSSRTRST